MSTAQNLTVKPLRAGRSAEFLAIFLPCFAVFLLVAVAAAMVGVQWRQWLPGAEGDKSLLAGVKAAVYSFMSYLN